VTRKDKNINFPKENAMKQEQFAFVQLERLNHCALKAMAHINSISNLC